MVTIELFGTLSFRHFDGRAIPLGGQCGRLLAYLALHAGRHVPRAELLESLWRDDGDRIGPGVLNTALWRLRGRLRTAGVRHDALLACDAAGVTFDPCGHADVDVARFERLAAPATRLALDAMQASEIAQLGEAATLYRADLLPDFTDDWALRERERRRRLLLSVLARLAEHAMRRGAYGEAIARAQAILDREPLREDVHCVLMRAFVGAGQRALALQQYERCRALLRAELAIAPMPDTQALYRSIAESALPASIGACEAGARTETAANATVADIDPSRVAATPHEPRGRRSTDHPGELGPGDRRRTPRGQTMPVPETAGADVTRALEHARRCVNDASRHLREGLALIGR